MSDIYKEKEWNIRKKIEDISSVPFDFEDYVEEVDSFIDRLTKSLIESENKNYLLEQKTNAIETEIKKIIYEIEHNPRTNAEIRDKYIVEKLKEILGDKENE